MSQDLFEAARDAMALCHAPYSKFPVGAAIRADDGNIYAGANIEVLLPRRLVRRNDRHRPHDHGRRQADPGSRGDCGKARACARLAAAVVNALRSSPMPTR
jgi:hypothetical protein